MSTAAGEDEITWDQRILEKIPSGVDVTLIDESLRLTPTERVERMRQVLESLEGARASRDDRLPKADSGAHG